MFLLSLHSAEAQVSIGISTPNVSIGINMPVYPELVPVPGYPVYYAPQVAANYFFYDGMYWVYEDDNWYASSWYNGPWALWTRGMFRRTSCASPFATTGSLLLTFAAGIGMHRPAGVNTGDMSGSSTERGWDKWKRGSAPAPAPLPVYQRKYAGDRYPDR